MKGPPTCSVCGVLDHNKRTCPQNQKGKYAKALPLLASLTNQEIADQLGVPAGSIYYWRKKAGIPSPPVPKPLLDVESKYPGLTARLGRESDVDLGRAYDLSPQQVGVIRQRRGIALYSGLAPITPEITALLGVISDAEIHRRYPEFSSYRLRQAREALNIPPITAPQVQTIKERLESVKDRIGVNFDQQIANELKVSVVTVSRYRRKLGLPRVFPRGRRVSRVSKA